MHMWMIMRCGTAYHASDYVGPLPSCIIEEFYNRAFLRRKFLKGYRQENVVHDGHPVAEE